MSLYLRSFLFTALSVLVTALECFIYIPALALPRATFLAWVRFYLRSMHALERHILGLDYEVRGREHLPKDGVFIVAMKHLSTYETLKLHLLFPDPAVILKKELLRIPFWGAYLKKSDVIAIDRSSPEAATQSIQDGARRMQAQGRPIIIFPQGTRVTLDTTTAKRPYKYGIAKIQEATGLPIIPCALNTGYFWPRDSWLRRPGTVVFKFLEPIPAGLDRQILMRTLEDVMETETKSLVAEAKHRLPEPKPSRWPLWACIALLIAAAAGHCVWWKTAEDNLRREYAALWPPGVTPEPLVITGFPGLMTVQLASASFGDERENFTLTDLRASGLPYPALPLHFETGEIALHNFRWHSPLTFQSLRGEVVSWGKLLTIRSAALTCDNTTATLTGTVDTEGSRVAGLDLTLNVSGHEDFLKDLVAKGIIEDRAAQLTSAGLTMFRQSDGVVSIPVTSNGRTISVGPFPVGVLP